MTDAGQSPAYVRIGRSVHATWRDAAAQPAGAATVAKLVLAALLALPLLALLVILFLGAIAAGLAVLLVGWVWGTARTLVGRGGDAQGRENVRVIVRNGSG